VPHEREEREKLLVGQRLVVQRNARKQRIRRSALELSPALRPGAHAPQGMGRLIEEAEAGGVARRPVAEVAAPTVHLCDGHLRRIVDEYGDQAHLVRAFAPQLLGERVIAPDPPRDLPDLLNADPDRTGGVDSEAAQAAPNLLG